MKRFLYDVTYCILALCSILCTIGANLQDILSVQQRAVHLPEAKFGFNEYSEYPDGDDRDKAVLSQERGRVPLLNRDQKSERPSADASEQVSEAFDKNIVWDPLWATNLEFGQISGVSIDPNGNIVIFHRGSRIWGASTFNDENRFDRRSGPVEENTVVLLDKSGRKIQEWGKNMFYLPHGLTIDHLGNYWITDVALHQVFKFDARDVQRHVEDVRREEEIPALVTANSKDIGRSSLKPALILGEAFEPGNDERRFCKPTAVAVQKNGDFFVSDGYCNSRIIKFNAKGDRILQWGRHWGIGGTVYSQSPPLNAFFVPHALALSHELNYVFVADRENGRVLSFFANNATFHKEYKHPVIGKRIYSIAYAQGKLYLINGPDPYAGYKFGPKGGMDMPHDLAVTESGSEIYAVELNLHRVYKFVQALNASAQSGKSITRVVAQQESAQLTDTGVRVSPSKGTRTKTLVLSLVSAAVVFILLCIAIAALVARCQKRGCLLTMRKRMRWEAERRENFKLSGLLESRRGKGFKVFEKRPNTRDFSKLNTEPETSEDEHPENSLAKVI
ncbi:hypothetical protein KM043_003899 [Ampulex compressa]|nr:hypothetical protein KM043_003899 [Ampulex compressa]